MICCIWESFIQWRAISAKFFTITFLCLVIGCHSTPDYNYRNHPFNHEVIEKLPIYDSLGRAIIQHYSAIYKPTKGEPTYVYIDYQDGDEIYKDLPQDAAGKIKGYITELGPNFFFGFDLYKDSTMKIYVRDTLLKTFHMDVFERLSFFPAGTDSLKKRDFPSRDTILNKNWQYWIRFDNQGLFH